MPFVAQPREICVGCGKTVYATEKVVIEERAEKKVFHKQCIRCKECNKILTVAQLSSLDGVFYCKTHFQQLFKTKGNYDESFGKESATKAHAAASGGSYSAAPASFVPGDRDSSATEKAAPPKTSTETQAKFRAFRTEGESRKCRICDKTVYAAEEIKAEEKGETYLYHKGCFRCQYFDEGKDEGQQHCNRALDLRSYGSHEGKIFCQTHLGLVAKSANQKWGTGNAAVRPASFVPADQAAGPSAPEKKETPAHIANRFKFGSAQEKCKSCGKTVYATEKIIVEERDEKHPYHKICLRCSDCDVKLDLGSFASLGGVVYCQVHIKERTRFAKQAVDNAYFVSPLANVDAAPSTGAQIDAEQESQVRGPDSDDEQPRAQQQQDDEESGSASEDSDAADAAEEPSQVDDEPAESEEEPAESAFVQAAPATKTTSAPVDDDEAELERRKAEREAEREARKAQLAAEEAEREAEREKRRAEREARREELAGASTRADSGVDDEIAELEKRRAERAARRKQMEEEAEAEAEALRIKREERRAKLAELKE